VFAGWVLPKVITADELDGDSAGYRLWHFLVRYVAPLGLGAVFFSLVTA